MFRILRALTLSLLGIIAAPAALPLAGLLSFAVPVVQARDLPDFPDLVERAGPAVVNIRTTERG
ncbi:MAG: serine peptidase, partial [Burkholderiales bacterium]